MCLMLIVKATWAAYTSGTAPLVFTVALFLLPLLYAFPSGRQLLARHRWPALGGQAVLTWVPFALFAGHWTVGLGGMLAALAVLMFPGRRSWLAAGALLAADVAVRATVTGLEFTPALSGGVWAAVTFVDDGLFLFGMVGLAQIVGEVDQARRRSAELAVTRERLNAAQELQTALGEDLARIMAATSAALSALPGDAARAREWTAEAGRAARGAAASARRVAAAVPPSWAPEPAGEAGIGSGLSWAVLVAGVAAYNVQGLNDIVLDHDGLFLGGLLAASYAVSTVVQLRHSWAARRGTRPRAWPLTLTLQAVLAYAFFLPQLAGFMVLAPFLAASVLLLLPGGWRWTVYAVVIVSWAVLNSVVPLHGLTAADRGSVVVVYEGAGVALVGMAEYGLTRLAGLARELDGLRGELARVAAVRERLRVARDVHDLLGLGVSAIALKADLVTALIGRDDGRATAEIREIIRICASAQADIRRVAGACIPLSLAGEAAAARQILTSAGIAVNTRFPAGPLPAVADEALAPVLREAVTNVLRHAAATACAIELTVWRGALRLEVSNDGAADPACRTWQEANGGGRGLANLAARVQAVGGQLAVRRDGGSFRLVADIPPGSGLPLLPRQPRPQRALALEGA
jgi:two-component system sensor histidine kinase DesK